LPGRSHRRGKKTHRCPNEGELAAWSGAPELWVLFVDNGHHNALKEGVNDIMLFVFVCIELHLKGSMGNCDDM